MTRFSITVLPNAVVRSKNTLSCLIGCSALAKQWQPPPRFAKHFVAIPANVHIPILKHANISKYGWAIFQCQTFHWFVVLVFCSEAVRNWTRLKGWAWLVYTHGSTALRIWMNDPCTSMHVQEQMRSDEQPVGQSCVFHRSKWGVFSISKTAVSDRRCCTKPLRFSSFQIPLWKHGKILTLQKLVLKSRSDSIFTF